MDFNKLYKKIAALDQGRQVLNESEQPIEECGMMSMSPMGGMDERPTTMSVNMNASGAEGIRELLNILQGRGDDMPSDGPDGGPAGVLIGMDGPDDGPDGAPDIHGGDMAMKKPMMGREPDMDEEYANIPQPAISGMDAAMPTGDDLNSKGKEAAPVNGGGNPLAENLRGKLTALYYEIKNR
jgi:hypothetical protein